jgi:glycosyltransferase involved in cell wall biosynthesis/ubiquinone/menaquinone biosynthesis C-methylase UbiE
MNLMNVIKMQTDLNSALDLFRQQDYYTAYDILFNHLKQNPENKIINMYLAVFAYATGNKELSNFYIEKIGWLEFQNFISEKNNKQLLKVMFSNHNEHSKWDNYRRLRNKNEVNRFGVTAPYCKGNVLEVGCANGDLSTVIAVHSEKVFGVDINPVAIELARFKAKNFGLNNCYFTLGDGAKLSFPDNSFDTVVLAEVLEHVPEPSVFIKEALRVCKNGGKILISVPKGYSIPDPDHVRIFTKDSLLSLIESISTCKTKWINEVPNPWLFCYIEVEKENTQENKFKFENEFLPSHLLAPLNYSEKVSIIIPTYNRAIYLKESLESVLSQSYPNKEIIVVNDGSTDDTEEVVQQYKSKITYISKENGGKSSAINVGLKKATGTYVWIFDDDDIALPKKLELQVRKFQQDINIGFIHTSAIYLHNYDDKNNYTGMWEAEEIASDSTLKLQLTGNRFFTPSVVVKMECFKKVGPWDESLIRAQDYDMWTRIGRYYRSASISLPTLHYRLHSGIRGTNNESIKINELQQSTIKYHRQVVQKLYNVPIEEIFKDTQGCSSNKSVILVEAYLERALYLAMNNLVDEAAKDIEQAKNIAINNSIRFLNFTARGLQIIGKIDNIMNEIGDSNSIVNVLYFVKMVKKANIV